MFITVKEKSRKNSVLVSRGQAFKGETLKGTFQDKLKQHSSRSIVFSQDSVSVSPKQPELIAETAMRSLFSGKTSN